jgi:deoxycytidylate deaminase
LKHPDEVKVLRAIYGSAFILVGVYREENERRNNLTLKIQEGYPKHVVEEIVEYFMKKDLKDSLKGNGQNVRDTFPKADLFINGSAKDSEILAEVDRFTELLFSDPRPTPIRDEYAMFHAYAASIRSSAPGRQVGAAITNSEGEILCLGTNEVAKPGGGHYWYREKPDRRAITEDYDPNAREKLKITEDLFQKLRGILKEGTDLKVFGKYIEKTKVADITEFDRTVHAETSALSLASRAGISIRGGTLFCTTFPCHLCAKSIIAAGIKRVVYVEPYPKSKAPELYPEAFGKNPSAEFTVSPFMGIGARLFFDLFSVFTSIGREIERKDQKGKIIDNPEIRLRLPTRALSHNEMEFEYLKKAKMLRKQRKPELI